MKKIYFLETKRAESNFRKKFIKQFKNFIKLLIKFLIKKNKPISNSFVRTLYYDSSQCDFILLKVCCKKVIEEMVVNGNIEQPELIFSKNSVSYYKCEKALFEPWENILSFSNKYKVKSVSIFPGFYNILKKNDFCPLLNGNYKIRKLGKHEKLLIETSFEKNVFNNSYDLALSYIINSFNNYKSSKFSGTFFTCYDLTNKSYRLNSWVWTSGIVIKLLCKDYEETSKEHCLNLALKSGEYFLKNQVKNGLNEGAFMVRWDISKDSPIGIIPWLAPNDSAFLAANGLMSLYYTTKEEKYLDASIKVGEWIIREGMERDGHLYLGFRLDYNKWEKSKLYVDAGFTATLFEELFKASGNKKWADVLKLFIDDFINKLYVEKGYFYKTWEKSNKIEKNIFARGQAWALDGLLSAYSVLKNKKYLDIILTIAKYLIKNQNKNGSWHYLINFKFSGECAKATPIIAYHLLRIYEILPDYSIIFAVKKALNWCYNHQYLNNISDENTAGGIHSQTLEGAITSIRDVDTIFTYSVAYYLLALKKIKELKIAI